MSDTSMIAPVAAEVPDLEDATSSGRGWRRGWRQFRRRPIPMVGLVLLIVVTVIAAAANLLAPKDPAEISAAVLADPSGNHWFGTDEIGRDLFSRLLFATRFSLLVSLFAVVIAVVGGSLLGLLSGYLGGKVDSVIMRITDAILAFPGLLVAMGLVGILGPGVRNAMLGLAIAFMPVFVRLVRGETLAVRQAPFVEAASVAGISRLRIVRHHIIPNVSAPVVVQALMTLSLALLAEGALSFLGLSVQPPESSLGSLLQRGFTYVEVTPRLILVPGLTLTLLSWSFNAIADGLRDGLAIRSSDVVVR